MNELSTVGPIPAMLGTCQYLGCLFIHVMFGNIWCRRAVQLSWIAETVSLPLFHRLKVLSHRIRVVRRGAGWHGTAPPSPLSHCRMRCERTFSLKCLSFDHCQWICARTFNIL